MVNGKLAFLKTRFSFSKIFLSLMFFGLFFGVWHFQVEAAIREVRGYAWSDTVGWISFSSGDCDTNNNGYRDTGRCGGNDNSTTPLRSNYQVTLDDVAGNFTGYAWADTIGWIRFEGGGALSGFPNVSGTQGNNARIDTSINTTRQISGWARACAGTQSSINDCNNSSSRTDGWDGWISLRGTNPLPNYGVTVDYGTTGDFRGYAWGSDVIGWISFNCADNSQSFCNTRSDYRVTIGPPPEEDHLLSISVSNNSNAQGYVTAPNTSTTQVNCGYGGRSDCEHAYSSTQTVILSATTTSALSTDSFVGWTMDGVSACGTNSTCAVNVDADGAYITATFNNGGGGPVCGNGTVESGETCDDGNTTSGDGCSSSCQTESATCSDGIQNQNETGVDTGGVCDSGGGGGETCSDGIQNQNETGIDTGGVCGSGGSEPPSVPTGLNASTGLCETGTITLRWNTVSGAAYYKILKDNPRNDDESNNIVIRVDGGGTSSYSDMDLGVGETHNYKIRACDSSNNCSAYSSGIDAQSPAMCRNLPAVSCPTSDWKAPENFMATKGNCGDNTPDIVLTWNDASDETYYEIYRATNATFNDVVSVVDNPIAANTTYYNDGNDAKNAGRTYYYAIRACKSDGVCSNYNYTNAETPDTLCDYSDGNKNLRMSVFGAGGGTITGNYSTQWFRVGGGSGTITGQNSCDKSSEGPSNGCDPSHTYDDPASGNTGRETTMNSWTTSPSIGSVWGDWVPGYSGSRFSMNQDHVVIGRFDSNSYSKIPVCEPLVDAACGSAISGSYENPPTSNLCSPGTASAVTDGGTTWNWTCNGSGGGNNAPCSATKINRVTLSVTKSGNGSGTATSSPSGLINCGSDCSESFDDDSGTVVTLRAAATGNSAFTGWSGVSCGEGNNSGNSCTVTMRSADISVNAAFQTGFSVTPLNSTILATIVEGLSANSSEATLVFSGQSVNNINLTALFSRPQGDAQFSEDNGQTWKNVVNFSLSGSKTLKFRVRNVLGSTASGTYPITIQARDNGGNVQTTTINLQVEKITTQWQEI